MSRRNLRLSLGSVLLVVCTVAALAVNRYFHHSTLTPIAAAKAAVTVEYAFNANGIMFGSESSPLVFVSATRNGTSLPVSGTFTGADDVLAGTTIKVKNNSSNQINQARLTIDLISGSTGKVVGSVCTPAINNLAAGAEHSQLLTTASAGVVQQAIANAGGNGTRVLVRVDLVQFSTTGWKYGLIHRPDPNNPNVWVPDLSGSQTGRIREQFKVVPAAFRSGAGLFACGYFHGYGSGNYSYCYCNGEGPCEIPDNELWDDDPTRGAGPFDYGQVGVGCAGYYPFQCPDCSKKGYLGVCP